MMMNCQSCGGLLPQDVRVCPHCGTLTPAYYSTRGENQAGTVLSGGGGGRGSGDIPANPYDTPYADTPVYAIPHTDSPYSQSTNPYRTATPPPPPASPSKRSPWFLAIAGLLILVVLSTGLVILWPRFQPSSENTKGQNTPSSSTVQPSTPSVPLTAEQAQKLYNQTTTNAPTLNDPLTGPDNFGWDNQTLENTGCAFVNGAYHSKAVPGYISPCYASATNFSNFVFQAEMTIITGHTGGLIFRADKTNDKSYVFRVSTDGTYILNKYTLTSDNRLKSDTLTSGQATGMNTGANLLAVLARGEDLYLFINKKYVATAHDNQYHSGAIGVYTDSDAGNVEAFFREAQVWQLQ
jgi:hypothetical protein